MGRIMVRISLACVRSLWIAIVPSAATAKTDIKTMMVANHSRNQAFHEWLPHDLLCPFSTVASANHSGRTQRLFAAPLLEDLGAAWAFDCARIEPHKLVRLDLVPARRAGQGEVEVRHSFESWRHQRTSSF